MKLSLVPTSACLLLLAASSAAQTPFEPLSDLWITDSGNDRIDRVRDLNYDGDFDDAAEVAVFYDDTLGALAFSNNVSIVSLPAGVLLVADTTQDFIALLRDTNADGDANDTGEAVAFFNSLANAAGIEAQSINGITASGSIVYAAVAQGGSTGKDFVLRLEDLNADGDANDAGEAREYFVRSDMAVPGSLSSDSLAQDVEVGNDGRVYYLEVGTSGLYTKGIYALDDADANGTIDPLTEVSAYFLPLTQASAAFHWAIEQDANGWWSMQDTGNDFLWRFKDLDNSGSIDPVAEATKWWTAPGASLVWDTHLSTDGALYVGEAQTSDRLFLMRDADASGIVDPGEVVTAYDETVAAGASLGVVRGFALDASWQQPWTPYCTAQANSLGCTPAIAVSGWPSASHGSGCTVTATNVRNNKPGLLLYSLTGRAAQPLNGGTLCLASPIKRVAGQVSGGTPTGADCTGVLTFDFNAYIASGANPALVEGAIVDAQYWSRDPGSVPGNTNLTSAVEFAVVR